MHPFDAASFLSGMATPAEGSFEPPQQQQEELGGAASSPTPTPSRGTRAGGENAGIRRCQDCLRRGRVKAYCAHCCSSRGSVCPGAHVNTSHVVPASPQQCSERQRTIAAASSALTAAVDVVVEPIPNKRPRQTPLPSVAAAAATPTTSSVDEPIATTAPAVERFAGEVSMDAVFRRVRLAELEEVVYYTTVTIAGHVFRGVLYDVGPGAGPGPHSSGSSTDTDGSGEVGSSLSTAGGSCCLDLALGL